MNNKFIFTAVITAIVMITTISCESKDPLKAKAEKFSEKFCECAGPSATFLDKMKNEQPEDIEALIAESEEIGKGMQDCMGEEYMDPFKDLAEEDKEKFDSLFQGFVTKKCVDIAKSFGI